jgi:4-aminobutyrate aminotransferase/(S)-3-amino-2-methylpropionate transaminase
VGALIVEPVQARAGVRIPPAGFLRDVSQRARARGVLVIADELFTGAGRCGAVLASPLVGLEPDLVCVGKALGGGLPFSACLGRAEVMDAWPSSPGEALHTSTFLGHPLACAAAHAALDLLAQGLDERAAKLGERLLEGLRAALALVPGVAEVRGLGLLLAVELVEESGRAALPGAGARVAEAALAEGLLVLPAGDEGNVVELAPPSSLTLSQSEFAVEALGRVIRDVMVG